MGSHGEGAGFDAAFAKLLCAVVNQSDRIINRYLSLARDVLCHTKVNKLSKDEILSNIDADEKLFSI